MKRFFVLTLMAFSIIAITSVSYAERPRRMTAYPNGVWVGGHTDTATYANSDGELYTQGDVEVGGNLHVTGTTAIGGAMSLSGTTITGDLAVSGSTSLTGTTTVVGVSNLNGGIAVDTSNFTVSGTTGAVSTASTLAVAGASSYTGTAALNGGITVDTTNFTVDGTTGAVLTASTLAVGGSSSFTGTVNTIGNLDVDGDIVGDGGGSIYGMSLTSSAKTASYSVTAADVGKILDNTGAGGAVTFDLPGCVDGYNWGFTVSAAQNLVINPDDADQILGLTDSAGDSLTSAAAGDYLELTCVGVTNLFMTGSSDANSYTTSWVDTN